MSNIFEVFRSAEPALRSLSNYCQTYDFFQNGVLQYRLHYCSKYGFTEPCELQLPSEKIALTLQPVKKIGGFQVVFLKADQLLHTYNSKKLLDAENRVAALVVDPTSVAKKVLRNILQGDPDGHLVTSPDKKTLYARIKDCKHKSRWPWPLSIVAAILSLFSTAKAGPRFTVEISTEPINTESLLVLSVLLDAAKGHGV